MIVDELKLDDVCMGLLTKLTESFVTVPIHHLMNDITQLSQHICLLADNRDIVVVRQSDWHLKVDTLTVMFARLMLEEPHVSVAKQLLGHLMPQYHEAKQRQDKKAAWLRGHPGGLP